MPKIAVLTLLFALCVLATSSCGWHLRGSGGGAMAFDSLHISATDQRSVLVQQLTRQLESSGINLFNNATEATYSLVILGENSEQRTATVSASARVSERSLTEQAAFLVLDKSGTPVIPRTSVSVERIYEYNEDNVLATDDEAELLKREMSVDLARQIYNHLRRLKKTKAVVADAPAS